MFTTPREPEPYLYILMRSDLDSLNPGKAVAQGAHAANQFAHFMNRKRHDFMTKGGEFHTFEFLQRAKMASTEEFYKRWIHNINLFRQWETSTPQGFGVTITLDVNGGNLPLIVEAARSMGFPASVTHDPSYPLRDGLVTHLIPLDTCGYVFGDKPKLVALLGQFELLS